METYEKIMRCVKGLDSGTPLSEDFTQWDLRDEYGTTISQSIVEYIKENKKLPEDFNEWHESNKISILCHLAKQDCLPEDFDQWELKSSNMACSIAHVAAQYGSLPDNFNQWDLRNNDGRTVAHEAFFWNRPPKNFTQWDLKDNNEQTVAHEAAEWSVLPLETFHEWGWKNKWGKTVFEKWLKKQYKNKPDLDKATKDFTDWDMVINENGETCRDVYERLKEMT